MLFLNKKTGLQWEVSNAEHIGRLLRDSDYELIKEKVKFKPEPEIKIEATKNIKK